MTLYPGERAENSWDGAAEETVVAAARTVARTANFMVEVVGVKELSIEELWLRVAR